MKLEELGALIKANELFELVAKDINVLKDAFGYRRLADQQVASADSIAANIEEDFGRGSKREYTQFLIIARGSAQETKGRYGRMKQWLDKSTIDDRKRLCDEIIGILTATINTLKSK